MKKSILIVLLFFSFIFKSFSTHIVGGEIGMNVINAATKDYQLYLNLYFDAINGVPAAETPQIILSSFEKTSSNYIDTFILNRVSTSFINPPNKGCASVKVSTKKIVYSLNVKLSSNRYLDPQGFYIVWERCCRNSTIVNIQNPENAGSTFLTNFPPLNIRNNSPNFKTPNADFICVNTDFSFDFSAIDADNDSLSYELKTPINGHSDSSQPKIAPTKLSAPYDLVTWKPGFNANNAIPGIPPLYINPKTGILNVKASAVGLYVFSILCREKRNGIEIGSVSRDYQFVVTTCPVNQKPNLFVKNPNTKRLNLPSDTIFIDGSIDNCLQLKLVDKDINQDYTATTIDINRGNFALNTNLIDSKTKGTLDSSNISVCIPKCYAAANSILNLRTIIVNPGCDQTLRDTVYTLIKYLGLNTAKPFVSSPYLADSTTLVLGQNLSFDIIGLDSNNNFIELSASIGGMNLSDNNMTFVTKKGYGTLVNTFSLITDCKNVNVGLYNIKFILKSNSCFGNKFDTLYKKIRIINPPGNLQPTIYTDLQNDKNGFSIPYAYPDTVLIHIDSLIKFNLFGADPNVNDVITLSATGNGFLLSDYGMKFNFKRGLQPINSSFEWIARCNSLEKRILTVNFIVSDGSCNTANNDTLKVIFKVFDDIIDRSYQPINYFSPNGDGANDILEFKNLPDNNCEDNFEYIEIYNRWGKCIYRTQDKSFQWSGDNTSEGIFYALIKYRVNKYKTWVMLVR